MLVDGDGNRMTPSHAVKKGTRYRYYVSRPLITQDQTERSAGLRIPAGEIEQVVTSRVRQWLRDPGSIYKATSGRFPDPLTQRQFAARAALARKPQIHSPASEKGGHESAHVGLDRHRFFEIRPRRADPP
jgi:hypothetical protein